MTNIDPKKFASMREIALNLFNAGIRAADPTTSVISAIDDNAGLQSAISAAERIYLLAMGKAAISMASAALSRLPAEKLGAMPLVVTNHENETRRADLDLRYAGHPLPDHVGLAAAGDALKLAQSAGADDLVLTLVSGGASAMMPCPPDGISLADKQAVTDALLASGALINEINAVRKHLSLFKGGRYAAAVHPAMHFALILSDVIGDDLSAIASGPTVADGSSFHDALDILERFGIEKTVPDAARNYLRDGANGKREESIKADDPRLSNCCNLLVGGNSASVRAMLEQANSLDEQAALIAEPICGNAEEEAGRMVSFCKSVLAGQNDRQLFVGGGETTVQLRGAGKGGRNQQFALAFALEAERLGLPDSWLFLSGGTDGRDGPTDAAGALVDPQSLGRMRKSGIDPAARLKDNDAYNALASSSDLILTGGTGTNVADLQILMINRD